MKTRYIPPLSLFVAALLLSTPGWAEKIEEQMPPEIFKAAGLDRLTARELGTLNDWLEGRLSDAREAARSSAPASVEPPDEIRSSIDGEFTGWDGTTVFRLKNGQVWSQRTRGRWRHRATDPEVLIERNMFGFFRMTLLDEGRSIGVKLVREE